MYRLSEVVRACMSRGARLWRLEREGMERRWNVISGKGQS